LIISQKDYRIMRDHRAHERRGGVEEEEEEEEEER
jgi:hypothetical protein